MPDVSRRRLQEDFTAEKISVGGGSGILLVSIAAAMLGEHPERHTRLEVRMTRLADWQRDFL